MVARVVSQWFPARFSRWFHPGFPSWRTAGRGASAFPMIPFSVPSRKEFFTGRRQILTRFFGKKENAGTVPGALFLLPLFRSAFSLSCTPYIYAFSLSCSPYIYMCAERMRAGRSQVPRNQFLRQPVRQAVLTGKRVLPGRTVLRFLRHGGRDELRQARLHIVRMQRIDAAQKKYFRRLL